MEEDTVSIGEGVDEETISTILERNNIPDNIADICSDYFSKITVIKAKLLNEEIHNSIECRGVLSAATGLYMSIITLQSAVENKISKIEIFIIDGIREKCSNLGQRFYNTEAEKQAQKSSLVYRNFSNLLQSYLDACDEAKTSCQSLLRSLDEELRSSNV